MPPPDRSPLPVAVQATNDESAAGFLIRVALANLMPVPQLLLSIGVGARRMLRTADVEVAAWMTHVHPQWYEFRVPLTRRVDKRLETLFLGQRWRSREGMRRSRLQVCPACIREHRIVRMEWDLTCYCACPDHGLVLLDHCFCCGRSIDSHRPDLDVCTCGHYLTGVGGERVVADALAIQWCEWVAHTIRPDSCPCPDLPRAARRILSGMSVDGAARLIVALAGGARAVASAKQSSVEPWLPTRAVAELMTRGMRNLIDFAEERRLALSEPIWAVRDLTSLALDGLTDVDRARAIWLLTSLRGIRVPMRISVALDRQPDLFL